MAKQKKESVVPPEIIQTLIKEYDIKSVPDIENALKDLFGETLQNLLEAELSNTLGYEKHDSTNKETENRRNGQTSKTDRSEYGEIELEIPRDRNGEFEPLIVKKHQKNVPASRNR